MEHRVLLSHRPNALQARVTASQNFHAFAGNAICGGDAHTPSVTDGPFAESAEVAGSYYVVQAENLDEALELASHIPAAKYGGVEIWPMAEASTPGPLEGTNWLALLLEPPETPGTPQWQDGVARRVEFGKSAGGHLKGGAGLHPPSTATTVRVRDGEVSITHGPFVEGAEVANGV